MRVGVLTVAVVFTVSVVPAVVVVLVFVAEVSVLLLHDIKAMAEKQIAKENTFFIVNVLFK